MNSIICLNFLNEFNEFNFYFITFMFRMKFWNTICFSLGYTAYKHVDYSSS